jgi:hypothetical protein
MTSTSPSRRKSAESRPTIGPERYAEYIRQIELTALWLHDARIQNHAGPETPERAVFGFETTAEWSAQPDGFRALHHYRVRLDAADAPLAEIDVSFGLHFRSEVSMSEELFELFQEVNLPVNTWPYLREFVATALGRMNWVPFTLPALKRGTGSNSDRDARHKSSVPRRRAAKTSASE